MLRSCVCWKFSEPEVGFVVNLLSTQGIPRLSLCGTVGEASTSWCLGHGRHALPFWRQDLSLLLPALSRHGSNSMARGHGRCEKGRRNRASDTFSAVSNLIHSISRFINVCMFSLTNLTAS